MRQFLKVSLASCLGTLLAIGILVLIGLGIASRMAKKASQPPKIAANTVLHLRFNEPIPERTNNLDMNPFDFENQKTLGLQDIVRTLEAAGQDDQIRGVFLEVQGASFSQATMDVLQESLRDFKTNDKFIVAYGDYFGQGAYYLASTADQLILNPTGQLDFHGFVAIIPFFKNMLDKIGIDMQIFYAGDFKSATEPYRLDQMSDDNRLQVHEFLQDLHGNFLQDIADNRNLSVNEVRSLSRDFQIRSVQDALDYGLIDQIGYYDQAQDWMRNKMGLDESDELELISLERYFLAARENTNFRIQDKIAIVYAEGSINMGDGEPGIIGDKQYVELLQNIRQDDAIKAVVLRVNSPGGSALASENIWRELVLLKEAHKPLIVSMGDYAASGGYYIACLADTIIAHPNTLTGSIGVFNIIPNASGLFNDHLGITFDTVRTGQSVGLTPFFELSPQEVEWMENSVDTFYEIFLQRVADGRGMTRDQVHAVAQGRVWTGTRAQEIGLVDLLGDLDDGIEIAASMAGLENYRLSEYPEIKDPLQQFLEEFTGEEANMQQTFLEEQLGEYYTWFQQVRELQQMKGLQARLPFLVLPR